MKFPKAALRFWDEGQKRRPFHWFQKGFFKRHYRKRFYKDYHLPIDGLFVDEAEENCDASCIYCCEECFGRGWNE